MSSSNSSFLSINKNYSFTTLFLLIYLDDLILTDNDINEINIGKDFLNPSFKIKDLGYLKYFLGFEIS